MKNYLIYAGGNSFIVEVEESVDMSEVINLPEKLVMPFFEFQATDGKAVHIRLSDITAVREL